VGASVPAAFYLLPDKKKTTYKLVLENLKEYGVTNVPHKIFMDFEKAAETAFREFFKGQDLNISGCDTHLKRNLRKHLSPPHNTLLTEYNTDEGLQTWLRYVWGLSLVPPKDIVEVYEKFLLPNMPNRRVADGYDDEEENQHFNQKLEKFAKYVEDTYVGKVNTRTNNRSQPMFDFEMFSKYNNIVNMEDTTTNRSEGFNLQLKVSTPRNATLWTLINQFRKEDALVAIKLREAAVGIRHTHKKRKKEQDNKRQRLFELVCNYDKLSMANYMKYCVDFYNTDLNIELL